MKYEYTLLSVSRKKSYSGQKYILHHQSPESRAGNSEIAKAIVIASYWAMKITAPPAPVQNYCKAKH